MIKWRQIPSDCPYSEVLNLQKAEFDRKVDARRRGLTTGDDIIFYVEHKPVITLGLHADESHFKIPAFNLKERGVEIEHINRGGDITYHGPGQLTVYPVIDLLRYRLGVKDYVSLLEQAVIDTIGEFGLTGERIPGRTGVWIGKGSDNDRKISAIGIKCSRFVSMHGLALNVGSDLSGFSYIMPCGLTQGVTSISREIDKEISVGEVIPLLNSHLIRLLQPRIPSQEIS